MNIIENLIPNTLVQYPFPDRTPWNIFPLGIAADGSSEVSLNVSTTAHTLLAGVIGTGKSSTLHAILMHALQSPDWRVALIDPKRVELSTYRNHPHVFDIAKELHEAFLVIEKIEQEMHSRYGVMQDEGVIFFKNLNNPPPAILLVVDELYAILAPEKIKNDEGKKHDEYHAKIAILIDSIARLGRSAGIHMVLVTQRPDANLLPSEIRSNIDARIAMGRMDSIPSNLILDTDDATRILDLRGCGILRAGNDFTGFQAYYIPEKDLEPLLEMAMALATGIVDLSVFQ